jgi:hypothetical protein
VRARAAAKFGNVQLIAGPMLKAKPRLLSAAPGVTPCPDTLPPSEICGKKKSAIATPIRGAVADRNRGFELWWRCACLHPPIDLRGLPPGEHRQPVEGTRAQRGKARQRGAARFELVAGARHIERRISSRRHPPALPVIVVLGSRWLRVSLSTARTCRSLAVAARKSVLAASAWPTSSSSNGSS